MLKKITVKKIFADDHNFEVCYDVENKTQL
jgi:hypothetical protein